MPASDRDAAPRGKRRRGQRSYAGIGSRRTPPDVLTLMESLAGRLAGRRCALRTGASPGADQAFFRGAQAARGRIELYLPWPGFEAGSWGDAAGARLSVLERPSPQAYELAARFHPRWDGLAGGERDLLARDAHEALGADLATPVAGVVCWTADGSLDGAGLLAEGTGQALRIAHAHGIPVFNLARAEHVAALTSTDASDEAV